MNVTPLRGGRGAAVVTHTNVTARGLAEPRCAGEERARRGEALLSSVRTRSRCRSHRRRGRAAGADEPGQPGHLGAAPMSAGVGEYREYVAHWPGTGQRSSRSNGRWPGRCLAGETSIGVRSRSNRFGDGRPPGAGPVGRSGGGRGRRAARRGGGVAWTDRPGAGRGRPARERVAVPAGVRARRHRDRDHRRGRAVPAVQPGVLRGPRAQPRTNSGWRTWPSLIHPDDRAENMALLRQLAAGQNPAVRGREPVPAQVRGAAWVHKWVTALDAEAGRAACLMALVTDVTERRRAEEALRAGRGAAAVGRPAPPTSGCGTGT